MNRHYLLLIPVQMPLILKYIHYVAVNKLSGRFSFELRCVEKISNQTHTKPRPNRPLLFYIYQTISCLFPGRIYIINYALPPWRDVRFVTFSDRRTFTNPVKRRCHHLHTTFEWCALNAYKNQTHQTSPGTPKRICYVRICGDMICIASTLRMSFMLCLLSERER